MLLDAIVAESPTVTRQQLNPGLIYSDGVNHGAESQPGAAARQDCYDPLPGIAVAASCARGHY